MDACRFGEGRTNQVKNPEGVIEDEKMLIVAAERSISYSDRVREIFENTQLSVVFQVQWISFNHQVVVMYRSD